MKTCVGITTSQLHTYQKNNGIAENAVRRVKEGTSALLIQSDLSEKVVERSDEMLVCKASQTNWQTISHRVKKDWALHDMVQLYHLRQTAFLLHSPRKEKSRHHQFGTTMPPGIFIGHALKSGGGWTRNLNIANWQDIEDAVASEVHVIKLKSKEVGIKKLQDASLRR